jgi:glycosyltransferase involved in cell wall biosynthesis
VRVALIAETFLPDVNGVAATVCRILEQLQAAGHAALLFAPAGSPPTYAGAEVVALKGAAFPLYPDVRMTPPQLGIARRLREFRPDVLHVVGPILVGALGPGLGRSLGVPVISSYHTHLGDYTHHYGIGFLSRGVNAYLRWIHNRTSVTLCPSTDTINTLKARGFGRLALWGRGVDTDRFAPGYRRTSWRDALGARPDDVVLLYVGRLAAEKRLDVIADALSGLERVRLVLVGDGPARQVLERRFRGLPVAFTGFKRGRELSEAYASADVFVFPSDTDTFGQVIQEAMASALPVVAARAGGAVDLVADGETGLLFAPNNAPELQARLRRLAADSRLRRAMGQAGRVAAERRSWPAVVGELVDYYRQAIAEAPAREARSNVYARSAREAE